MLQPVGPLPPAVYWRRRLVLIGGVLTVVLLLTLTMCTGGGSRTTGAGSATGTPTATATSLPSGPLTVPSSEVGGPAPGTRVTAEGSPGAVTGVGSPPPGSAAGPGTTAGPGLCPDSAIAVSVSTAKESYQIGDTPELILTVRNTSSVPCRRDVGAQQEQIQIYSGEVRVWSSDDCYADDTRDVQLLAPGQAVLSTVTWSGWNSQPGCVGTRTRVSAGTYRLIGLLGALKSPAARLVLV
ncbi:MAG: hypothetical protein HYR62_08610 [Actinobacteria bacterium]|nr:hypothetical protein [Actinomycetota bacterium]MBI3687474.1 hypothetical protein [Actinomycetota bacterium]